MDRQIFRIGSTVVNLANVTHAELDADPFEHRPYARNYDEGGNAQTAPIVVLYLNTITSANAGGAPMQRKITFDGEEARLLRKYFDHSACVLQKRSANRTRNASREAEVPHE